MEISHTELNHLRVHASERSQSSLRIAKGQNCKEKDKRYQSQVFRMDSSRLCRGIIREQKEDEETRTHESSPRKKVNLGQKSLKTFVSQKKLQGKTILEILKEEERQEYFSSSEVSRPAQRNENYNTDLISGPIIFPSEFVENTGQSSNELLTRTIEIMSNKNQKINIPIHEGLYKSNTSHKSDFDENNIPNICDFQLKNQYSDSIQFIREYKSGYTPIEMQKRNNQEVQDLNKEQSPVKGANKDKTRNHFIRKQQSTLTLPRTCGVSYIKPSESLLTQKQPFEPLPPLIFQGSTSCAIGVNQESQIQADLQKRQSIDQFNTSLENSWLPFIISDQDQMRDLLLAKKTKKARVGFVEGVENLWPLYVEGVFILILISPKKLLTEPQVWEAFENKQNFFKIGILSKKSTSGKKSFLKSIKAEQNYNVSVKSLESDQNQAKQSTGQFKIVKNTLKEGNLVQEIREISSEEKKVSSTFEMLEQELKDNRTVITMSLRLEMYVEEKDWKENYNRESKDLLNEIIISLKDKLEKKSIRVIGERLGYSRESKLSNFQKKYDFLRMGKCINTENGHLTGSNRATQTLCTNLSVLHKNTANLSLSNSCKQILISNSEASSPKDFIQPFTSEEGWKKSLKFPIYYISTRDSFAFDLIQKHTLLQRQNGQKYTRIDYYFYPDNIPTNYGSQYRKLFPNLDVGVTAYHGFFTEEEMLKFQGHTFELEQKAFKSNLFTSFRQVSSNDCTALNCVNKNQKNQILLRLSIYVDPMPIELTLLICGSWSQKRRGKRARMDKINFRSNDKGENC